MEPADEHVISLVERKKVCWAVIAAQRGQFDELLLNKKIL